MFKDDLEFHAADGAEPLGEVVEPEWGATRGDVDLPAVGPVFDLIAQMGADVAQLHAMLTDHPVTAGALAAGSITVDHVTAIRVIADANSARREAFVEFEPLVLEAAVLTDPRHIGRIMAAWAESVDPDSSDDDVDAAYGRRRVHLSEVADGWSLRGWLPGVIGAELAGILNAFKEQAWGTANSATDPIDSRDAEGPDLPASVRRADALMDAARAAGEVGLTPGARDRAKVTLLLPIEPLHTCPECEGHHHGPGQPCDLSGMASTLGSRPFTPESSNPLL